MRVQGRGTIRGTHIDLEEETGLPPDSAVTVSLVPVAPSPLAQTRQLIDTLCGAWSADESLRPVFEEIQRRRTSSQPRDVHLDAAP